MWRNWYSFKQSNQSHKRGEKIGFLRKVKVIVTYLAWNQDLVFDFKYIKGFVEGFFGPVSQLWFSRMSSLFEVWSLAFIFKLFQLLNILNSENYIVCKT